MSAAAASSPFETLTSVACAEVQPAVAESELCQSRREEERGCRRHEQRRERLAVVMEADVDLPLPVRPRAVACDHADEQRPDRPARGCEDADRRRPVALRPRYATATTVSATKSSESANPKSHATCLLNPNPSARYANIGRAQSERPAEDRGAARHHPVHVDADDEPEYAERRGYEPGPRGRPPPPEHDDRNRAASARSASSAEHGTRHASERRHELPCRRVEAGRVAGQAAVVRRSRKCREAGRPGACIGIDGERDCDPNRGEQPKGSPPAHRGGTLAAHRRPLG